MASMQRDALKRWYGYDPAFTFDGTTLTGYDVDSGKVVFKIGKIGEDNMCMDCTPEGAAPMSYREQELERENREFRKNHLGAQTERFIEMSRELGRNDHLRDLVCSLSSELGEARRIAARATEQAAYSDNETDKANKRAEGWQQRAYTAERLHSNLVAKNRAAKKKAANKPVAKTTKK